MDKQQGHDFKWPMEMLKTLILFISPLKNFPQFVMLVQAVIADIIYRVFLFLPDAVHLSGVCPRDIKKISS
nr:hypothetical protein CFP56_08520 [Quercus suber]